MLNIVLVVLIVWAVPVALIFLRMRIYARAMMRTAPASERPASYPTGSPGIDWNALESELASCMSQSPVMEAPAPFDSDQPEGPCPLCIPNDPYQALETPCLN